MKTALVTGGCGFIGSNLVKELVKLGWQVDVVDNMSNGHLELLEGLKLRVLPNGSFYTAYKMHIMKRSDTQKCPVIQHAKMQITKSTYGDVALYSMQKCI